MDREFIFMALGSIAFAFVAMIVFGLLTMPFAYLAYQADIAACEKKAAVMGVKNQYVAGECFVEYNGRMVPLSSIVVN